MPYNRTTSYDLESAGSIEKRETPLRRDKRYDCYIRMRSNAEIKRKRERERISRAGLRGRLTRRVPGAPASKGR